MEGLILSIESSTLRHSIAISAPDRLLSEVLFNIRADGGKCLSPAIREMMNDLSISFGELSAIAVSHGPGSFTGLRIGVATAKTLAHANGLPLYAVNSLLLLAFSASFFQVDVCPLLDARRGEVYAALYRFREEGLEEKMGPAVMSPEELVGILPDPVVLVGEGTQKYRDLFRGECGEVRYLPPPSLTLPRASNLSAIVHMGIVSKQVEDIMGLEPLYIRRPEAELKWKGKTGLTD